MLSFAISSLDSEQSSVLLQFSAQGQMREELKHTMKKAVAMSSHGTVLKNTGLEQISAPRTPTFCPAMEEIRWDLHCALWEQFRFSPVAG